MDLIAGREPGIHDLTGAGPMIDGYRPMWTAVLIGAALLAAPFDAEGQQETRCESGLAEADLGVTRMIGSNLQIHVDYQAEEPVRRRFSFGREPVLEGIRGPGVGRLEEGDLLVSVDGIAITTEEGGRRFSDIRPGDRVRLGVRRDGRIQDVTLTAGERCMRRPTPPRPPAPPRPVSERILGRPVLPDAPPAPSRLPSAQPRPPAAPAPPAPAAVPRPPAAPAPPAPPAPPRPPEGWFGFGISCRDCGIHEADGRATFRFGAPPSLMSVEPGTPAARAGLRRGDLLTHVDGASITTPEGWRRFGAARPGQTVRLTYTRDGQARTVPVQAVRRPDAPPVAPRVPTPPPASAEEAQRLRYAGVVNGSRVEVRGSPVTVTTDDATGETIIRSHDLVVRIRPERP
jgi:hypothetical protein